MNIFDTTLGKSIENALSILTDLPVAFYLLLAIIAVAVVTATGMTFYGLSFQIALLTATIGIALVFLMPVLAFQSLIVVVIVKMTTSAFHDLLSIYFPGSTLNELRNFIFETHWFVLVLMLMLLGVVFRRLVNALYTLKSLT